LLQNLGRSNYGFHYELSRRLHRPPRGSLVAVSVSKNRHRNPARQKDAESVRKHPGRRLPGYHEG
jgi:hypothetical protein